jgi:hypothetical protein
VRSYRIVDQVPEQAFPRLFRCALSQREFDATRFSDD